MKILGIDVETTGFNANTDYITEVGAVLWDWEKKAPVRVLSELIKVPEDVVVSDEITEVTGITRLMLDEHGKLLEDVIRELKQMDTRADICMAHNAPFDKGFLQAAGFESCNKWADTCTDVIYPKHVQTRKLTHLAADHGFANPFAHRAVFDVLTMLKVVSEYSIMDIVRLSSEPTYRCVAQVNFAKKDLAKERGYRWDGENKQWVKLIKKSMMELEKEDAPFFIETMEVEQ